MSEGTINHFGAVRLRAVGVGSLRMSMNSVDYIVSKSLTPITMAATSHIEALRLCNMTEQRASLRIETTGIGEVFNITKIAIYLKPVANMYPG